MMWLLIDLSPWGQVFHFPNQNPGTPDDSPTNQLHIVHFWRMAGFLLLRKKKFVYEQCPLEVFLYFDYFF